MEEHWLFGLDASQHVLAHTCPAIIHVLVHPFRKGKQFPEHPGCSCGTTTQLPCLIFSVRSKLLSIARMHVSEVISDLYCKCVCTFLVISPLYHLCGLDKVPLEVQNLLDTDKFDIPSHCCCYASIVKPWSLLVHIHRLQLDLQRAQRSPAPSCTSSFTPVINGIPQLLGQEKSPHQKVWGTHRFKAEPSISIINRQHVE